MRWIRLLVLAGVGPACGDNIRMIESGTRLEAIVDVGGEGAESIAYYRDRELGIDCAFVPDTNDDWRCLPRATVELAGFADASCATPIVECRDCGESRVAVLFEPGCTGLSAHPLRLAETEKPAFIAVGDACVSANFPPGTYYTASVQAGDDYVMAAFEDHPISAQLGTRALVTPDGAHELFHHGFERTGGRDCSFFGGITGRCLPGTVARTELGAAYFFADAGCSSRVAFSSATCSPPTHARFEGAIHAVSSLAEPAFERSPVDSSCFPSEEAVAFFAIGPVDAKLPVANVIALGSGAARPVYYATGGSPIAFANRWVDVDGMSCTPLATTDGRRCIGRSLSLFGSMLRYADAGCSIELAPNPESDLYALRWAGATSAREVTRASTIASVHALRAYPATEMYEMRDGVCTLSPEPAVLMAFVGPALDLQKFPIVERRSAE